GWVEARGGLPLVHRDLLRDRGFAVGLATAFLLAFANISFYLLITLYMQNQLHFTPLQSGMAVLPVAIAFALVSRTAGPRTQRLGVRAIIQGCVVSAVGLLALLATVVAMPQPPIVVLSVVLVIFGAGQAMVMAPLFGRVLALVPQQHAGSGSGVLSQITQIGNATGVAVIGAVYFGLGSSVDPRVAMAVNLTLLAAAFVVLAILLRERRRRTA